MSMIDGDADAMIERGALDEAPDEGDSPSAPAPDEELHIDGYDVISDVKVALNPVALTPAQPGA